MVKTTKNALINPFFFLNDACGERAKDVMEYYSLLLKHDHKLKEADFKAVYEGYFNHKESRDIIQMMDLLLLNKKLLGGFLPLFILPQMDFIL